LTDYNFYCLLQLFPINHLFEIDVTELSSKTELSQCSWWYCWQR